LSNLNVFLIKDSVTDPDKIVRDRGHLWSKDVRIDGTLVGVLYVEGSPPRPPRWLSYFAKAVDFSEIQILSAFSSAVLLVPVEDRIFAVVFGYGRHLLNHEAFENRFGLRVTLNAIAPTSLRSLDHTRLDTVPRHTREQLAKGGGVGDFGLDVERDLLRAVTGTPADGSLGRRLSGSDSLSVTGEIPLASLTAQLGRYLSIAAQDGYKTNFSWVDNIAAVTGATTRSRLDERLVEVLVGDNNRFWLAVPDLLDWEVTEGFRFKKGKKSPIHDDLELDDYFVERRPRGEITIDRLRQDELRIVNSETGVDVRGWSVYKCLVGELSLDGNRFVLSEGNWYRVDADFLAAVEADIVALEPTKLVLPKCGQELEADYNKRAARRSGGDLVLLDQDFIEYPRRGRIEVCDLYSRNKVFVHVKKAAASSVLSHLFSQGLVSATLLLNEPGFRTAFQAKLPDSHHWGDPARPFHAADFEIAYAIITKSGRQPKLPFFSKVNLRNACRMLRAYGFNVTLTAIPSSSSTK
jgi:uncharacterized protein (TIGR04141 family)